MGWDEMGWGRRWGGPGGVGLGFGGGGRGGGGVQRQSLIKSTVVEGKGGKPHKWCDADLATASELCSLLQMGACLPGVPLCQNTCMLQDLVAALVHDRGILATIRHSLRYRSCSMHL